MAKIVIADDDVAVRSFVARALEMRGHVVTSVECGEDALGRLGDESYDLLITDVMMPGMDGISLSVHALERHPQLRIIVMTGYAEQQHRAAILEGQIGDILTKPFSLKEICAAAHAALMPPPDKCGLSVTAASS